MNVRVNPRIASAAVFGVILITGSFWLATHDPNSGSGQLTTAGQIETDQTVAKQYSQDQLVNPNWKDYLGPTAVNRSTAATSTYTPPTTITGQYGVHLLQGIMSANMQEDGQPVSEIVDNSIAELDKATADKPFTFNNLQTTMDVSMPTLKAYGNQVTQITLNYPSPYDAVGDPLNILENAGSDIDEAEIAKLDVHIKYYEAILKDTRELTVPVIYQGTHLEMLNAYLAHLNDLRAMRELFNDPLLTYARLRNYVTNLEAIYNANNKLYTQMYLNGVRWNDNDVVSQFLSFENN